MNHKRVERIWQHYNTVRPHSSLAYRPPAPKTINPKRPDSTFVQ
ncbi:MAG: integrase core domain-containing protein [Rhodospirillales bacterium]|nr:integrase core domain-containing protein [Rhodospirillales bacterium]